MEFDRKDTNWIFFIEHLLKLVDFRSGSSSGNQGWFGQPRVSNHIYIIYIAFCFIYIWPTKGEQSHHLFFVANDDNDIEENDGDGDGDDDGNDDNDIEDDDGDDNAAETGSEEQQQGRRGSYGWWPEQGFCYFFY